jgi:uncharacterized membrane protein
MSILDPLLAPMREGTGYTPATTILIIFLLISAALFLLWKEKKILRKKGLLLDILPFILLGASIRSLEDACFYPCGWPVKLLFITPGIWLISFGLWLALERLWPKRARLAGWLLAIPNLAIVLLKIGNWEGTSIVLGFTTIGAAIAFGLFRAFRFKPPSWFGPIFLAHIFDASSTLVAVRFFGFVEEHIVARWLIGLGGTSLFYFVKIVGMFLLLLAIGKAKLTEEEKALALAATLAIGLGPGLRNSFSLGILG